MIVYRLTSDNHRRIAHLANWLKVGPDVLLTKIVETELERCEQVYSEVDVSGNINEKYELAATLQLLE